MAPVEVEGGLHTLRGRWHVATVAYESVPVPEGPDLWRPLKVVSRRAVALLVTSDRVTWVMDPFGRWYSLCGDEMRGHGTDPVTWSKKSVMLVDSDDLHYLEARQDDEDLAFIQEAESRGAFDQEPPLAEGAAAVEF